jgi:hypothetical protein
MKFDDAKLQQSAEPGVTLIGKRVVISGGELLHLTPEFGRGLP